MPMPMRRVSDTKVRSKQQYLCEFKLDSGSTFLDVAGFEPQHARFRHCSGRISLPKDFEGQVEDSFETKAISDADKRKPRSRRQPRKRT